MNKYRFLLTRTTIRREIASIDIELPTVTEEVARHWASIALSDDAPWSSYRTRPTWRDVGDDPEVKVTIGVEILPPEPEAAPEAAPAPVPSAAAEEEEIVF